MIVITNPTSITGEIEIIHSLFEEGLELLHIRKPNFAETEIKQFLTQIKSQHSDRLVLHSHFHLAEKFNIKQIHFNESKRKTTQMLPGKLPFDSYTTKGFRLSTSVHNIADFNVLDNSFEYAFLSPVYQSISKENYFPETNLFEAIKNRTNFNTKLVALGGIEPKNTYQTLDAGFDDVALLGAIWNSNNPIQNFKLCQQIALSY